MDGAQPRRPAVAGRFYPGTSDAVQRALEGYLPAEATPRPALALMAPHAGWMYSGAIAGETWAQVVVPRRVVLLCPNHTGLGPARSLWSGGAWVLPGGAVAVDETLGARLQAQCGLTPDRDAHRHEHAIEVHLPFARARRPDVEIAAICLSGGLGAAACAEIGAGLAQAIRATPGEVLIAASTDMSHYVEAEQARGLDRFALDRVLALDPEGLLSTVRRHRISMCGVIPTAVALHAALALGATRADLIRYGNSGEASGDFDRVVGYAGAVIA